jgi:hypothetical protein
MGVVSLFFPQLQAQNGATNGGLRGTILDADFSVPVAGATVVLEGTALAATTTEDGSFVIIGVPPGSYAVLISKEGFVRERKSGLTINPGSIREFSSELTAEVVELDEFVINAEEVLESTDTTGAAIQIQSQLKSFTEVLGQQFISQTGASDAAKLLSKTTGVNVAEGRFVVVRGLADRYNSVTLNGLRVPSSDPDRRAVALDLFPSSAIQDIRTSKTFLPDEPGESTGANIDIKTKTVPKENFTKIKVGTGFNNQATGNPKYLTYRGGGTGLFGTYQRRALPGFLRNGSNLPNATQVSSAELPAAQATRRRANAALSPEMGTKAIAPPPDFSLEASLGRRFEFMGKPAGLTLAADYSKKYLYTDQDNNNNAFFSPNGDRLGFATSYLAYDDLLNYLRRVDPSALNSVVQLAPSNARDLLGTEISTETMRAGLLASLGIELAKDSEVHFTYFFNRVAEDRTLLQFGIKADEPESLKYREALVYTQRQLQTLQLGGNHALSGQQEDLKISWGMSYNTSYQYEPDTRFFNELTYTFIPPTTPIFSVPTGLEGPPYGRSWRTIDDENYSAKLDIESSLFRNGLPSDTKIKLKAGGLLDYSDRQYRGDAFRYEGTIPEAVPLGQTLGDVLLTDNLNNSIYLTNENFQPETYQADQTIAAGYLMLDIDLSSTLNLTFGARAELTNLSGITGTKDFQTHSFLIPLLQTKYKVPFTLS